MNDRLFRQHIAMLVERKRKEAEAQVQAESALKAKPEVQRKPPARAKAAN